MTQRDALSALSLLFGRFARPHWRWLVAMCVLSALSGLATAIQPLILAPAVDTALLTSAQPAASLSEITLNNVGPTLLAWSGLPARLGRFELLVGVVVLFVLAAAAASALNYVTLLAMRHVRFLIASDIQAEMYRHVLSLPMSYFASQRIGNLANRFAFDAVLVAQSFDPLLKGLIDSGLQVALYGYVLFRTDPRLAASVAGLALLHLAINRLLQGQIRTRTTAYLEGYGQVAALIQEALVNVRVVKSFSAESFERERLQRYLAHLKHTMARFSVYAGAEQPLRDMVNALVLGGALLVSFGALSSGRLTLSGFVLFVVVVRQTILPFAQLNTCMVQLHSMLGAAQRVLEILHTRNDVIDGQADAGPLREGLALESVSFAYEPGTPVLSDVQLRLPRGSVTALVGPSGAGKSTLADLVLRLSDPQHGRVCFDGRDVRELRQHGYRQRFGVVPQEPLLFNLSVAENIAYNRPLSDDAVERAAQIANADGFIRELPLGYATPLGERGARLSGGQRQRIALARAVYAQPDVLILDEATSALDSEAERQVQRGIEQAMAGRTTLVIAHRLSTVMRAERIVVLERGRIVAQGAHSELLLSSPLYRRLYTTQFQDGADALVEPDLA